MAPLVPGSPAGSEINVSSAICVAMDCIKHLGDIPNTANLDLIATEMLAIPSKSSRNKNHSNPMVAIP